MKRIATIVLSIMLIVNLVIPVNAGVFVSETNSAYASGIITKWMDARVIHGYKDGSFKPDQNITRGEMAQILSNLLQLTGSSNEVVFKDVKKTDWYYSAVKDAFAGQIIKGYPDGKFKGNALITKQDAVVMLYKAFRMVSDQSAQSQFSDASDISDYALEAVTYFEKMGYLDLTENAFLPKTYITRMEVLTIIDNIVDIYMNKDNATLENVSTNSVLIVAKDVTLKNVNVEQSLFVADAVGDSDVHLNAVKVKGTSYLNGGGSHSIHILDSEFGLIFVDKRSGETLRVLIEGDTSVDTLQADNSIILENETGAQGILKLKLSKNLDKNSFIKLVGSFKNVESDADGINIQLEGLITFLKNNGVAVKVNNNALEKGSHDLLGDLDLVDETVATGQLGGNGNSNGNNGNGNGNGNTNGNINNGKVWTMTWNDEFNGNSIDPTKWTYDIGNWIVDGSGNGVTSGWGNNEKEYYTNSSENSYVKAGKLVIEAKKEQTTDAFGTYDYTSAKLKTKGLFSQTFGRYEIRAKLPVGKGLWPAIWMLPEDDVYGGWAASGEIDIMEGWGSKPDTVGGTLHYGGLWPGNKYTGKSYVFPSTTTVNAFHEYALEWEPGEIRWYVDGVLYQTQNNWYTKDSNGEKFSYPAPFDQDFYMILNLAVGGNFDGDPTADTPFPSKMEVDYVRVYELTGRDYRTPTEPTSLAEPLPEGAKVPTQDGNLLTDGSFEGPIQNNFDGSLDFSDRWNLLSVSDFGGSATQSIDTIDGTNYAKIDITSGGNQNYSVQLIQTTTIGKGRYYKVSFDVKSNTARNINMKVGGGADVGYVVYSDNYTIGLTDSFQHVEKVFQMQGDTNLKTRLEFNLGLNTNPVWIGNVRIEEIDAPQKDYNATKTPLADGNGIYNGAFDKETIDRLAYWNILKASSAEVNATVAEATRELCVTLGENATQSESVTVDQRGLILEKNSDYHLSFMARAAGDRTISVKLVSADGTVQYLEPVEIALNSTMTLKEMDIHIDDTSTQTGILVFDVSGTPGKVYLDNVKLTQTTVDYSSIDVYPIENGDFSKGLEAWSNYVDWTAGAAITADNGEAKIAVDHVGPETWGIQLYQGTFVASNKVEYIVAFDVKSSIDRNLEVIIDNASYNRYLSKTVAATTEYTHYEFEFKFPVEDTVSLKFLLGKTDAEVPLGAHDIIIDNVVCQVKNAPPAPMAPGLQLQTFNNVGDEWISWWGDEWAGYASGTSGVIAGEMVVELETLGGASYAPQLYKEGFKLENNKTYVVSFDVRSDLARKLNVNIGKALSNDPWFRSYAPTKVVDVTTEKQTVTYEFTVSEATDENLKMVFELGTIAGEAIITTVYLDNISIVEGTLPDNGTGNESTGPNVKNGTFDTDLSEWATYMNDGSNALLSWDQGRLKITFPDYAGWFKWSTQVYQGSLHLEEGKTYSISFDVVASENRDIWVEMTDMTPQTVAVTTDVQTISFDFTANATVSNGKLIFLLGTDNMPGEAFTKNQILLLDNIQIAEKQ